MKELEDCENNVDPERKHRSQVTGKHELCEIYEIHTKKNMYM